MEFIHDDFLLSCEPARRLYHHFAATEPILDYHSHLAPADIASDRRFHDLCEIWLEAIIINGEQCGRMESRNASAQAMLLHLRNSRLGLEPSHSYCVIPCTTGRISN